MSTQTLEASERRRYGTERPQPARTHAATAPTDGLRELAKAIVIASLMMAPIFGIGGREVYRTWREQKTQRLAAMTLLRAHSDLVAAPALPVVSAADAAHGRDLFVGTCAACHGQDAQGVQGLGKDLVRSNFVASINDQQLHKFLIEGRPDALPLAMPPKGGRTDLTDSDIDHLVAYLRGLQDPRRMPALPAPQVASTQPNEQEQAAALAAAGGDAELAGYIASGRKIYASTCFACHGPEGAGVKGNGKALAHNDFVKGQSDDDLLAFVKKGRAPSDPKNTTGIQMPPKGGNPALSDDDLLDVISYLRTLQGDKAAAASAK